MKIAAMTFRLRIPWANSLKDKRAVVRSLEKKLRNRFRVSVAEIDAQDLHRTAVIGVAAVVPHSALADSLMDEISRFAEEHCEAEIAEETREIR